MLKAEQLEGERVLPAPEPVAGGAGPDSFVHPLLSVRDSPPAHCPRSSPDSR